MKFKLAALVLLSLGLCFGTQAVESAKVVGYYPCWVQYSQFFPKDVRYNVVTHLHYTSLTPVGDGSLIFADDTDQKNFEELAMMAQKNGVKLVAVVGGIEAETILKTIAASEDLRKALVSSALQWVKKYALAGIELDWQNLTAEDAVGYASLITSFADAFQGKSLIAASTYPLVSLDAYDVAVLNRLDYVTVFVGDQMNEDVPNLKPNVSGVDISNALRMMADKGVEKARLVPVAMLYGKSFMGAQGFGSAHKGTGSGNEGFVSYKEMMNTKFVASDYKVEYDATTQSEIAVSKDEAIVFTGIPSLKAISTQIKTDGFGGIALYDVSQDHPEPIISLFVTVGQVLRPELNYAPVKKKK